MGALDEGHCDVGPENSLKLCVENEEEEIQSAVRVLLQGLGEDITRDGIIKTPLRVAKALRYATQGYTQNAKEIIEGAIFPEAGPDSNRVGQAGGAGGLVVVHDIDLFSYCESCLLPFQVQCHVGYVPAGKRVVGLSKLPRVAEVFAKRLQDPQRLADQICSALQQSVKPAGVAVILQCYHMHFPGLESVFSDSSPEGWINLVISSGCGVFEDEDADSWDEFFSLLKFRNSIANKIQRRNIANNWCPYQGSAINKISPSVGGSIPCMVSAVTSILRSLGENPQRKELIGTPTCFLKWLMNFQNSNVEMKLNAFIGKNKAVPQKSNVDVRSSMSVHSELKIPFWSQCEHHLLPFHGVVHLGYFSTGVDLIGKSLLQSIVHFYGFKLQVQERLTRQIAEAVAPLLGGDVIVVAEASHMCMIARGIEKLGSSTSTVAVLGQFATDAKARALFFESLPSSKEH